MMDVAERAQMWAYRMAEMRRVVDAAPLAHAQGTDTKRCYLCRRTEKELAVSGMPRGFWLCAECKVAGPTMRSQQSTQQHNERHQT